MQYTRYGEPFALTESSFMELYDKGMDYFHDEVLALYTDTIINDPMEGIQLAFSDFLSNDSPIQDETGEYLSWEDALKLGQQVYDLSNLNEFTKKFGPEQLKPRKNDEEVNRWDSTTKQ